MWIRGSNRAVRRAAVAALAVACGASLGIGTHWMGGTEPSGTQVTATVLQPAEPDLMRPAIGQWTTPEGDTRAGVIPAPPGHPAGAEHPVWIDETGHITDGPGNQAARIAQASVAGALGSTAVVLFTWPRKAGPGGPRFAPVA